MAKHRLAEPHPKRRWVIGGSAIVVVVALGAVVLTQGSPSAADLASPSTAPSPHPTRSGASTTLRPSPSPKPRPATVPGVTLQPVDGGPDYYGKFADPLPTSSSFFPIALYYEAVGGQSDIDRDRAAGINTYVELDDNSNFTAVDRSDMHVIARKASDNGNATNAWSLDDEVDMRFGAGSNRHTGGDSGTCVPKSPGCGYTVMQADQDKFPKDGKLRYANYGKGVLFWMNDQDAAKFVNGYQDVVSADSYWFQDTDLCSFAQGGTFYPGSVQANGQLPSGVCHMAANYGKTVSRVRDLESPANSKPVWAFIEDGHVSSGAKSMAAPTGAQITAGVWSSLIHGARGIIYFNDAYGGCQSTNVLADPCYSSVRTAITKVDNQVKTLAPVLNAPFVDGVTTASDGVDVATKWSGGHLYVFAGANQTGSQKATFTLPCVGDATVTVLDESRTISMTGGAFSDAFADSNAIHLYRVDGGSSCGLSG